MEQTEARVVSEGQGLLEEQEAWGVVELPEA
jgi:hypothetical protein